MYILTRGVVTSYSISVEMFANGWGESVGWVGDLEHMVGRVWRGKDCLGVGVGRGVDVVRGGRG